MSQQIDELTPIAEYMVREMTHNPWTPPARKIRELNSIGETCTAEWVKAPWWRQLVQMNPDDCVKLGISGFFAACKIWYKQVKTDAPWDHKPILKQRKDLWSKSIGSPLYHIYGDTAYSFDVWSNMHYGYVGRSVGFSPAVLLDGAGAAQAMSDWKEKGRWPRGTGPSMLPRRFDRAEDRASITLGTDLWTQYPDHLNAQMLVDAVTSSRDVLQKPASEMIMQFRQPQASGHR
jgi:hypothetical protein